MKYTKEFKEEALKLSDEIGVRRTAEQLGLKYNTLKMSIQVQSNLPVFSERRCRERTIS